MHVSEHSDAVIWWCRLLTHIWCTLLAASWHTS